MNTNTKLFFVFVALFLCLEVEVTDGAAATLVLPGIIRDQAPAYMIHPHFPAPYWSYAGWTDSPNAGSAGTANGSWGWTGGDFELPMFMYGTIRTPNAPGGLQYNGELGLMGGACNTSNGFTNCGVLGSDGTPQYQYTGRSPEGTIQGPDTFYTWFHDNPKVISIPYNLTLNSIGGRQYQYSGQFFPIDGRGWDDSFPGTGGNHNFAFCLEINAHFAYYGGEIFQFTGDDDVWVYLDSKLVIDLGGVHTALSAEVYLDDMGLTLGNNYRFDFFYCERHSTVSDLEITTSLAINCNYYDQCNVCEGDGQSCCTAAQLAACTDNNACTQDLCTILANGPCQHINITTSCPGNQCFIPRCDTTLGCQTTPLICNDNNVCTTDSCNNATGCVFVTNSCSGDKCNIPSCDPVKGCSTTPVVCNDNNLCTNDSCNPLSGCSYVNIPCPTNACNSAVCNATTGCVYTYKTCNDNNVCTRDSCDNSTGCSFTTIPCGDPTDKCKNYSCNAIKGCNYVNISCDDNDVCTDDVCVSSTGCQHTRKSCDDGNVCTTDSCVSPSTGCQNVVVPCNDNNVCTTDKCNSTTGCYFIAQPCTAGDACTNNTCDPVAGCQYKPLTCDDHNACTNNTCDKTKGCQFPSINCNDNNPCTADSCDINNGCLNSPQACNHCKNPDGSFVTCAPQDGNLCFPLSCDPNSGACNITQFIVCDDQNNCTADSCTAATGQCLYTTVPCDDGDPCTNDVCDPVTGCSHTKKVCDDGNPCTSDACREADGQCTYTPINGTCLACGANACVTTNPCYPLTCNPDLSCSNTTYVCNDNNPCTMDSCYTNTNNTASCNFAPVVCNNTNLCAPQSCNGVTGMCDAKPVLCDDNNPCTQNLCSPADGSCSYPPIACNNTDLCNPQTCNTNTGNCDITPFPCDDNNVCTNNTCAVKNGAATCVFPAITCPDFGPCIPGICNATVGCVAGTFSCEDNNPCTLDVCGANDVCNNTVANLCDDENACTTDTCDYTGATLEAACSHTNITCVAPNLCQNVSACNTTSGCTFVPFICPPSTDWCQVPICDNKIGCLFSPKPCIVKDPDCYVGSCDSVKQQCVQTALPNWESIPSQQKGVTCYAFYNKAKTAAIITAGVIAAIVVAAVVFAAAAAFGARKAYLYMQLRQGNIGAAHNNPLFVGSNTAGSNPLFA